MKTQADRHYDLLNYAYRELMDTLDERDKLYEEEFEEELEDGELTEGVSKEVKRMRRNIRQLEEEYVVIKQEARTNR